MSGSNNRNNLPSLRRFLNEVADLGEYNEEDDPPYVPREEDEDSNSSGESDYEGEVELDDSDHETMDVDHAMTDQAIPDAPTDVNAESAGVTAEEGSGSSSEVGDTEELAIKSHEDINTCPSTSRIETESVIIEYETDCPICCDAWQEEGIHKACSLACGHTFGRSCIEKWIRSYKKATCPKCKAKCKMADIRPIYPKRVVVIDKTLQKEVDSLKGEIKKLEAELLTKDALLEEIRRDIEETRCQNVTEGYQPSGAAKECTFILKQEFGVYGARVCDLDASCQIMLLSRRLQNGACVLTKFSLVSSTECENIPLPSSCKTVRDLSMSPINKLALLALIGNKLSVVCWESKNVVLSYDLPAPAWSCTWDTDSPHHVYAGLQNGMLVAFDLRQTVAPLCKINGLTSHPVHSLHSVGTSGHCNLWNGVRSLVSASAAGPCQWNIGSSDDSSPFLIPCTESHSVCISLAYCQRTDDIVASFRPRVLISSDHDNSQVPTLTSSPVSGSPILGSHVHMKRIAPNIYHNDAPVQSYVSETRMPKSAVIDVDEAVPLYAHGNEVSFSVRIRELPSLKPVVDLRSHELPILDIKFAASSTLGLLGCISEDRAQVYSVSC